jgi:peptide/nickel transport system substrate-binding protein
MVPNTSYSGPNKPTYKEFIEKPFTTSGAEFNALVGGTIDVGALPGTDVTSPATSPTKPSQTTKVGKNNPRLKTTFNLLAVYRWGINYFPENFNSTGDTGNAGPIFKQLYFRQAFQSLVNQTLYINRLFKGYGVPTYGPVPVWPHNPFSSKYEETNPYPYNPAKAKSLLKSHGWKVVPGGTSTCVKPGVGAGKCGKGIKKGAKLAFTLQYVSGTKTETHLMAAEKASWEQAGIRTNMSSATFNAVIGAAVPCPKGCKWTMENWGGGWIYSPDYYPTGEEIFASGAGSNSGNFTTATNNKLIKQTDVTKAKLTKYENWLANKLPVVWQPEIVTAVEIHKGITHPPLNPLDADTPATFHWK